MTEFLWSTTMPIGRAGFRSLLDRMIATQAPQGSKSSIRQSRRDHFHCFNVVQHRSGILNSDSWNIGRRSDLELLVRGIARVARYRWNWVRDIESWESTEGTVRTQFTSLVKHLFVMYGVPQFAINGWFAEPKNARRDIKFLVSIGKGESPRKALQPLTLPRSMLRHFMSAPSDCSIDQAYRWAQVRSADGSEQLARTIANSLPHLSSYFHDDEFWRDVINFFARVEQDDKQPDLVTSETTTIIEFLRKLRFRPAMEMLGYRLVDQMPLQPEFSVKGRQLKWIRQFMIHWRELLSEEIKNRCANEPTETIWPSSNIAPFQQDDGIQTWYIRELRGAKELKVEGYFMKHCVGGDGFAKLCKEGSSSIWSLRRKKNNTHKRMATIEVVPKSRLIVTALGKCNEIPNQDSMNIIHEWAKQAALTIELY